MSRVLRIVLFFVAQLFVVASMRPAAADEASGIPDYFFDAWTISADCSEVDAGDLRHVQTGLQFAVDKSSVSSDGQSYKLRALDAGQRRWAAGWRSLRLEYRAGARMQS